MGLESDRHGPVWDGTGHYYETGWESVRCETEWGDLGWYGMVWDGME